MRALSQREKSSLCARICSWSRAKRILTKTSWAHLLTHDDVPQVGESFNVAAVTKFKPEDVDSYLGAQVCITTHHTYASDLFLDTWAVGI